VPLIASIFAGSAEEFAMVARIVLHAHPDILELNISCPNVHDDFGEPFAASCESAASVVNSVRSVCGVPLFVKLAPNVPNIGVSPRRWSPPAQTASRPSTPCRAW